MRTLLTVGLALAVPPASSAQDPILAKLPANATNLLVARDPLPVLQRILGSEPLREVMAATAELQREWLGQSYDPAALERQLSPFTHFIPRELVLAAPPEAVHATAMLVDALGRMQLLVVALRAGDADAAGRRRSELAAALAGIGEPSVTGWVRARDERTAESWFDAVLDVAAGFEDDAGVDVTEDGSELEVVVRPFALRDGAIAGTLRALQVDPTPYADLAVRAVLTLAGDTLELRVGRPVGGPLHPDDAGPLWRSEPGLLLFGRYDCEAAQEVAWALLEELAGVAESPALARLSAALARALENGPHYTAAIDVGDGMTWTELDDLGDEAELFDLAPPEITRCVDPADGPFTLAGIGLDLAVTASAYQIATRLAQRADAATAETVDARLGPLLELMEDSASTAFEPGVVAVVRPARLRSLRVGGAVCDAALPFGALAIAGKAIDERAAEAFLDRLLATLAMGAGVGREELVTGADLGLGVPTRRLRWQALLGGAPEIDIDGDFDPHVLRAGPVVVFSTDPSYSKVLLARIARSGLDEAARRTASWARLAGSDLQAICAGVADWIDALRAAGIAVSDDPSPAILRTIAAALEHLAMIEIRISRDGSRLREVTTFRLRDRGDRR